MSAWPSNTSGSARRRAIRALVASVVAGCIASTAIAAWCLTRVENGAAPTSGGLHVREGRFWWVATDRAFGLEWVNIERMGQPSINPALDMAGVPSWAEPRAEAGTLGEWRVGTLAVGWPFLMVTRQWSETDPDRLFVPHAEVDDDGFTIAKMAANFLHASPAGTYAILAGGVLRNVAVFGGVCLVLLAPRLLRSTEGDCAAAPRRPL